VTHRRLGLRPPAPSRSSRSGTGQPSRRRGGSGGKSALTSTTRSTGSRVSPFYRCWRTRPRTRRRAAGSGPPLIGGNQHPHPHGRGDSREINPQGRCGAARHRVISGGAGGHRGGARRHGAGAPQPSRKRKRGFSSLRWVVFLLARPRFRDTAAHTSLSFVVRVSPAVPDLAPIKVLKLRTSLASGRRSERAPRAVASVAAAPRELRTSLSAALAEALRLHGGRSF
jgi:hypothetical protein